MPKYTIELVRTVTHNTTLVGIEADTEEEAISIAEEIARKGDPAVEWDYDDEEIEVIEANEEPAEE